MESVPGTSGSFGRSEGTVNGDGPSVGRLELAVDVEAMGYSPVKVLRTTDS